MRVDLRARRYRYKGRGLPMMEDLTLPIRKTSALPLNPDGVSRGSILGEVVHVICDVE